MGMNKGFNAEKAVEVILYIISKGCCNMYNILKVIYFADKERLDGWEHYVQRKLYGYAGGAGSVRFL